MTKKDNSKIKVLVGLSGWVDSAVAAYLLTQQGYDVTAGFMKNYVSEMWNCTTYDDANEAIKVAKFLGIKLISFDLQKEYNKKIVNYIYEWYQKWITPNPDVLCNSLIKFDVFLHKALKMGFEYIATGHYAQIEQSFWTKWRISWDPSTSSGWLYKLLRGRDHNKDQSYFLSWLDQFQLSKSLFPLWDLEKPAVRKIARKLWLPNAERKDSQGLCFVGNIPIRSFLEQKLPKKEWITVDETGKKIWTHQGARFFTIGQRQGLNLPPDRYVSKIDVKKNIVTVGPRGSEFLNLSEIPLKDRHRIGKVHTLPLQCTAKIRYRQIQPAECRLSVTSTKWRGTSKKLDTHHSTRITASFQEEQRAVAPGQVVVAYNGEECLGNGVIA